MLLYQCGIRAIISLYSIQYEQIDRKILEDLKLNHILVPNDENELKNVIDENNAYIKNDSSFYMPIQPTANCPLGCGYCGQEHFAKTLIKDVQDKLVEHI